MLNDVRKYIERHRLLTDNGKYIVALSGGADSVALLLLLLEMGYKVEAAHCNFKLRGEESDRDEAFVRELCDNRGVMLHLVHFDTRAYAELHKVSIEMAARQLRYAYFEQLRRDIDACGICVAHHREDSVETLLINLIRGTGVHGLCGIRPRNGYILRPLLCVSRSDITDYLASKQQSYVTDSTNLVDDVARNKVRLNIMPLLREINQGVVGNIQATAERMTEVAAIYDKAVNEAKQRAVNEGRVRKTDITSESLLFEILRDYSFSPAMAEQVYSRLDAPTGRVFSSPTHDLLIDRDCLIIESREELPPPMRIPECGIYIYGKLRLRFEVNAIGGNFSPSRAKNAVSINGHAVRFPLIIRPAAEGDRFTPFGMRGSKLVSDYLTDRKRTLFDKRRQLVVTDAENRILWLVGERIDNRFRITQESKQVLSISYESIYSSD